MITAAASVSQIMRFIELQIEFVLRRKMAGGILGRLHPRSVVRIEFRSPSQVLKMYRMIGVSLLIAVLCGPATAQKTALSPAETAIRFYRALKEKKYVEGFAGSVYRDAIKGLSPEELKDLEPDFARTFTQIPENIEPHGENIVGDSAVVFLKFAGTEKLEQVTLTRVGEEWLVGDKESLAIVKSQGRAYFFNVRLDVNQSEAVEAIQRIVYAEDLVLRIEGKCASLEELVKRQAIPGDFNASDVGGYRYSFKLNPDLKGFIVTAVPLQYGKTGKLSFFANADGIRAEDVKGKPASAKSPLYEVR